MRIIAGGCCRCGRPHRCRAQLRPWSSLVRVWASAGSHRYLQRGYDPYWSAHAGAFGDGDRWRRNCQSSLAKNVFCNQRRAAGCLSSTGYVSELVARVGILGFQSRSLCRWVVRSY